MLDEDGDPLGRVMVRNYGHGYSRGKWQLLPAGEASADESGEFKASNLAPGRYCLAADGKPWKSVYVAGSPTDAQLLAVAPKLHAAYLEVRFDFYNSKAELAHC